ncbi:CDP-glycerol glycerophosphotransferase family protein [Lactiplantibacillus sp. WILCCON 0030]|uniref:CDP-glycerol glycerophosphotransferase family protein n=1 Tax=Lactiplantibacillus brownii TaxID=3069269 RepID=A0ABU1A8V0_9LACO|nr:CDP-glycerol glycerophosphotransferase family protein [Lactiplantibacillus brownii]MDQ7937382.1 CDP-glycerol glycerophosphotransferase family protein [Lactiplantibacillus brownii]
MGRLKTLKLKTLQVSFNLFYQGCYYFTLGHHRQVTFATMRSAQLNGNLKAVYQEFEQAGTPGLKTLCYHYDHSFKSKLGFLWASLRALKAIATSELFIVDDYFFPLYAIKKHSKNQVVQLWHAFGTLKKFGLSLPQADQNVLKPHTNYDWVFINTEVNQAAYAEAFEIEKSHILATGEPMMDELTRQRPETHAGPKRLLYSPTYRPGSDGERRVITYIREFIQATRHLSEDWEIYISLHPYLRLPELDQPTNVHLFQNATRVKTLMPTIDLFITDYSSLSLNFSYFERPILLWTPDYQDYLKTSGFYVDYYHYLGAPHFETASALTAFINQQLPALDLGYVKTLKAKTFPHQDGLNSHRVYTFLNEKLG